MGDSLWLKSYFKIEVHAKADFQFQFPVSYRRTAPLAYCISDCFVEDIYKYQSSLECACCDYVSFRNLISKVGKTKSYASLLCLEFGLILS